MKAPNIPAAELDILVCIWKGIATAAEIRKKLLKRRPMAHATVCTLLKRLEDKGMVQRKKSDTGKAFVYQTLIKPAGTSRSMLTRLLDRLFDGNGVALVASLLESRPPTNEELDDLDSLLKELRASRKK